VIVVAGVTNLQFGVPVDGFPVAYAPVRYPQGQTGVRVGGVGYNVAAALAALGSEVRLATFAGGDLRGAAYAVITNIGFARPLLAVARAAGVPVAADVQAIDDLDDDYNRDWVAAAQVLFCSHERLPVPPEGWVGMVQERYRTPVVVVGCGAGGALLGVRDTAEVRRVPAVAPRGVTSTAGASDALAPAFMHVYRRRAAAQPGRDLPHRQPRLGQPGDLATFLAVQVTGAVRGSGRTVHPAHLVMQPVHERQRHAGRPRRLRQIHPAPETVQHQPHPLSRQLPPSHAAPTPHGSGVATIP
jgi:sugar/nucleoside kinase (ribokinase family)